MICAQTTIHYFFIIILVVLNMPLYTQAENATLSPNEHLFSSHRSGEVYVNANPEIKQDMSNFGSILKRYMFEKRVDPVPDKVLLTPIENAGLQNEDSSAAVYRLGHSTVLLQLENRLWLTDPVFSKRASPVQWAGPKRFHPVPMNIDDMDAFPDIEGVIISHDHYDHLDKATVKLIHSKVKHFIVPLGVDQHLISWGVSAEKIHTLDWWQTATIKNVSFTATPAQHFSGRGLFDGNETLWASWVIKTEQHRLFFSGDSGYFDGFKLIGKRYGPFDLTMMETGAYDRNWADIHMLPEQSVQAHIDLRGKMLMPIHNSTFDLALHPWYEPFERLAKAAVENEVKIATPIIGEKVLIDQPRVNIAWWKNMMSENRNKAEKTENINALSTY